MTNNYPDDDDDIEMVNDISLLTSPTQSHHSTFNQPQESSQPQLTSNQSQSSSQQDLTLFNQPQDQMENNPEITLPDENLSEPENNTNSSRQLVSRNSETFPQQKVSKLRKRSLADTISVGHELTLSRIETTQDDSTLVDGLSFYGVNREVLRSAKRCAQDNHLL